MWGEKVGEGTGSPHGRGSVTEPHIFSPRLIQNARDWHYI